MQGVVRLLAGCLALAALLMVATLLPLAHAGSAVVPVPEAPRVQHPAWPAWAHGQAARAAPAAPPAPLDHTLNLPQHERQSPFENAGLSRGAVVAGLLRHAEQPLWLVVLPLNGRSDLVPAPPPRFT